VHLPRILDVHNLSIGTDSLRVHDYRNQNYIVKAIEKKFEADDYGGTLVDEELEAKKLLKKNHLVRNLVPIVPGRPAEERRRNIFESREVGIGQAQEEDDEEERERQKKAQWAKAISQRKAKFVEERQKMYAEQQEKLYESTANAKKAAEEMEKQESDEMTKSTIEQELQKIEDEYSAPSYGSKT
jgi:hypothetical protein